MQVLVATDLVSEELKISFLSLGIDVCGWLRLFSPDERKRLFPNAYHILQGLREVRLSLDRL
jgi:hypothetical protein